MAARLMWRKFLSLLSVTLFALVFVAIIVGHIGPRPQELLYVRRTSMRTGHLRLMDSVQGVSARVPGAPTTNPGSAFWSPDGRWIIHLPTDLTYAISVSHVTLIDARRPARQRALPYMYAYPSAFSWSADGSRLAFVAWDRGVGVVLDMHQPIEKVAPLLELAYLPDQTLDGISPDGQILVYSGQLPQADQREVLTYQIETGTERWLGSTTGDIFTEVTWSPDGSQFAYVSRRDVDGASLQAVFVMDVANGVSRVLVPDIDVTFQPIWSPDGAWIALLGADLSSTNATPIKELYIVRPDGSDLRPVSDTPAFDVSAFPAWSPDGERLAFVLKENMLDPGSLMVLDVESMTITTLTAPPLQVSQLFNWSPRGDQLAFMASDATGLNMDVYTVYADGSRPPRRMTVRPGGDEFPQWRPE